LIALRYDFFDGCLWAAVFVVDTYSLYQGRGCLNLTEAAIAKIPELYIQETGQNYELFV
jgi:hypothetical protein